VHLFGGDREGGGKLPLILSKIDARVGQKIEGPDYSFFFTHLVLFLKNVIFDLGGCLVLKFFLDVV